MATNRNMSRLVRKLRERLDLTQEKFAARLGVTYPTINRWENGRSRPSPLARKRLKDIVAELGDNDFLRQHFGDSE